MKDVSRVTESGEFCFMAYAMHDKPEIVRRVAFFPASYGLSGEYQILDWKVEPRPNGDGEMVDCVELRLMDYKANARHYQSFTIVARCEIRTETIKRPRGKGWEWRCSDWERVTTKKRERKYFQVALSLP
jgi:hypothetical protein